MPVFFSFAQVREDLAKHTKGLAREQVWRIVGANSLGFQLKHIAGSVDRLTNYLMGEQVTPEQLAFLRRESSGTEDAAELLGLVEASLRRAEARLRQIQPESIYEPRFVGRRALPTTVLGLLVHLAEHTQRHLGQAVTLSNIVRQTS